MRCAARVKDLSTHKKGPRPSPAPPSSVTSCSTAATTPRPLARHALDDLYGQDPVVGSHDFDYWGGGSPPPSPRGLCSGVLLRLVL
jgi:hypothetical protein